MEHGEVALCDPVIFELIFTVRNSREIRKIQAELDSHPKIPVTEQTFARALRVQASLAAKAQHTGLSLVDLLVAAAGEAAGLTVLHYDGDFEAVARITGQPVQWVVPPGTAD